MLLWSTIVIFMLCLDIEVISSDRSKVAPQFFFLELSQVIFFNNFSCDFSFKSVLLEYRQKLFLKILQRFPKILTEFI